MKKIVINKIGDSIYLNVFDKNKLKNTFKFSEFDLIFREDSKGLWKALIKHFSEFDLLINIELFKHLREEGIL